MREWMTSFEKAKRLMLQTEQLDFTSGTATINSAPAADTESPTNLLLDNTVTKSKATTQVDELPAISLNNIATDLIESEKKKRPSIVMLSTSPENDHQSLNQPSTSLTPLLVWEASRASMSNNNTMPTSVPTSPATQSFSGTISLDTALSNEKEDNLNTTSNAAAAVTNNNTSSSWGIPWALVPSMFQGGSTDDIVNELPPTPGSSPNVPAVTDADGHQVIWPTRVDDSNVPKVDLIGYPLWLDARNRELRHLFGGVGSNEVVLSGTDLCLHQKFKYSFMRTLFNLLFFLY